MNKTLNKLLTCGKGRIELFDKCIKYKSRYYLIIIDKAKKNFTPETLMSSCNSCKFNYLSSDCKFIRNTMGMSVFNCSRQGSYFERFSLIEFSYIKYATVKIKFK